MSRIVLSRHLARLRRSVCFRSRWEHCEAPLRRVLNGLSGETGNRIRFAKHDRAAVLMARHFACVPDLEFRAKPRVLQWVRFATDHRRRRLVLDEWEARMRRLESRAPRPLIDSYSGLKSRERIEAKIRAGGQYQPDLWDAVRSRAVAGRLEDLAVWCRYAVSEFGSSLVRCRNYYVRPRRGSRDPYRAIHMEVQMDDEEFVEFQLLTLNREAVGLIDHPFLLRRWRFDSMVQARFLRKMSLLANIRDAGL